MRRAYRLLELCAVVALVAVGFHPTAALAAPVCTTASLATYISLDISGGCTVGEFTFLRFAYPTPTSTGGAIAATASQIMVTPIPSSNGAGLSFSAWINGGEVNLFSVSSNSGTASLNYYINYSVDPAPIVYDSLLSIADPPYGNASVTQTYCTSDVLANGCQFGTESQQTVTTGNPTSIISFVNPSSLVDVNTDVSLIATPGDPAGFDSLQTAVDVTGPTLTPEPSSLMLTSVPVFLLWCVRRKRAQNTPNSRLT